ncbi:MAG: hypothetical protein WBD01_15660 [Salaquimonas sp.]
MAVLIFCGIGIAWDASMADRSMNYTEIQGKVTAAEFDCYVENRGGKLVEKDSDKKAYLGCDIAPAIAVQFGYSESDVKKRVKFTYNYTSPVDGSFQEKSTTREGSTADNYARGSTITVYAHNEDPAKSRLN